MRLTFRAVLILLASLTASAQNPCAEHPTQPHWHVFVDIKRGLCLEYPPDYKRVIPMLNGRRCTAKHGCLLSLEKNAPPSVPPDPDDEFKNASIELSDLGIPFRLEPLEHYAPTGYVDIPPEPVQFGDNTFYYYGAGGGGVTYADQFFFSAKGHAFEISFEGPYLENGSEPDKVTKEIEAKLLGSLRRF